MNTTSEGGVCVGPLNPHRRDPFPRPEFLRFSFGSLRVHSWFNEIALVAFPVTGLLAWRTSTHRIRFAATAGLCAAWYLALVTLFQ